MLEWLGAVQTTVFEWLYSLGLTPTILWWLGILSLVSFLGTLAAVPYIVIRIPANHFTTPRKERAPSDWAAWLRRAGLILLKNIAGVIIVLAGIAMCILPGQGLLAIFLGLMLTSVPGKRALLIFMLRRKSVIGAINWMRSRAGKPPLEVPPKRKRKSKPKK